MTRLSRLSTSRVFASALRFARRNFDLRVVRWLRLGKHQQRWYLKRLLPELSIDLILDVGGNAGQYALFLRRDVGYQGPIVTFEPHPELAAELTKRSSHDPYWTVLNVALGDAEGTAKFNIMNTTPMSSLLAPNAQCGSAVMQFNQVQRTIDVRVQTLDDLMDSLPILQDKTNVYLKLDVQGYELKVLEGAGRSLSRISALQAELSVIPLYENQPSYLDLFAYLHARSYVPSLFPAHEYETFPELIDFDAHFVRQDLLQSRARTPS